MSRLRSVIVAPALLLATACTDFFAPRGASLTARPAPLARVHDILAPDSVMVGDTLVLRVVRDCPDGAVVATMHTGRVEISAYRGKPTERDGGCRPQVYPILVHDALAGHQLPGLLLVEARQPDGSSQLLRRVRVVAPPPAPDTAGTAGTAGTAPPPVAR